MKLRHAILVCALVAVAACKATPKDVEPETVQDLQTTDATPALYVNSDDRRYVETPETTGQRQVIYYSKSKDTSYVVDETTGKIIRTINTDVAGTPTVVEPEGCGCG